MPVPVPVPVRRRWRPFALLALLAFGCSGPSDAPPDDREETTGGEDDASPPPQRSDDVRDLGDDAPTYADLLDAARTLDDRRDQGSDTGCLLRRAEEERDAFRLEADLAVAVRPLPSAPDDLDARLSADGGAVNVLSRWGRYGSGDAARPSFVAVTTTLPPLREPALVWVVTERGVFVRSSQAPSPPQAVTLDGALSSLGDPAAVGALYVAAEAGLPLARLADVLSRIPDALSGRVGLAVALEPDTRLPAPPQAQGGAEDAHCPDGLPPLPEDAPEGVLRPQVMLQSLGPLRQGAAICVGATQGPGAAGGRVVLAFRVGPDGGVTEACVVEDDSNDPTLRHCLARAARTVAFPAPSPPGYLDAQVPLVLSPLESQRQRALCR